MFENPEKKNTTFRVVLDTGIRVRYVIKPNFRCIDAAMADLQLVPLYSQELRNKLFEVLQRPRFVKYITPNDLEAVFTIIDDFGKMIPVTSNRKLCRDPDDDFILNLALDSDADYIVSGDKDLLSMNLVENIPIIGIKKLKELLEK